MIVVIDQVNVEIQVRTELQDTWAQIIEELADTWGRGIRYGEEPQEPHIMVEIGDFTMSRSRALALLKEFSQAIAELENGRQQLRLLQDFLKGVAWPAIESISGEDGGYLVLDAEVTDSVEKFVAEAARFGLTPPALPDGWQQARGEEAVEGIRRSVEWIQRLVDSQVEATRSAELDLRGTLQMIASATEAEG